MHVKCLAQWKARHKEKAQIKNLYGPIKLKTQKSINF